MKSKSLISIQIKKWRAKRGLTQDTLSKRADIPFTTLSKIESDVIKTPSINTLIKIAKGLSVSLDDLVKISSF
ncbi:helix-turn-helix transcriptional regulator [Candidatus Saganbacteria bacterium]|nr:helix-turn-helix transcriptional regulator [Candidatus Saganbacteria bacterium]